MSGKAATFINRSEIKKLALELSKARGFTQVSASFLDEVNGAVRALVERKVREHPTKGKTLKGDSVDVSEALAKPIKKKKRVSRSLLIR